VECFIKRGQGGKRGQGVQGVSLYFLGLLGLFGLLGLLHFSSIPNFQLLIYAIPVRRFLIVLFVLLVPSAALAEQAYLTRCDGYLLIWESIRRPAEETGYEGFYDVNEGDRGFIEITYGRVRSILEEEDQFKPQDLLTLGDAITWLIRTRNIAYIDDSQPHHLDGILDKYPFADISDDRSKRVTRNELLEMIRGLDALLAEEVHEVSFYADAFHGRNTAFGEEFNMHEITAAHRMLPHNTLVKVMNMRNGKSVVVRINDRGPYVEGRDMDLSLSAFEKIADRSNGLTEARFERLGDVSLVDACSDQPRRYQKRIIKDIRFNRGVPHTIHIGDQLVLQANKYFVIRGITYPDGHFERIQDFISPEEKYYFNPTIPGSYVFLIGTPSGKVREMRMEASACIRE